MTGGAGAGREAAAGGARWVGRARRALGSCASTSDEAAAWARATPPAPDGAVVVAETQTRGRGRLGRSWHSPPGDSLYLSIVLRPPIAPRELPPLTLAVAVAVAEACAEAAPAAAIELKWPNDVLAGGRKVAGILCELATAGERVSFVVVGVGVNVSARALPPELAARATSLALASEAGGSARVVDRDALEAALCARLERWYERFLDGGAEPVLAAWRTLARIAGRRVTVDTGAGRGVVAGVAEDVESDGALRLRTDGGEVIRVTAGDVAYV